MWQPGYNVGVLGFGEDHHELLGEYARFARLASHLALDR